MSHPLKIVVLVLVAAAGTGGALLWSRQPATPDAPTYRTATVERKNLVVSISASGTIEPEEIVDVGAQVAGKITEFGVDAATQKTIDYGSAVEPGTILARIDDDLYREEVELAKADLAQSRSLLAQAQTGVLQAEANLLRSEADLRHQQSKQRQHEREARRTTDLRKRNAISELEAETAVSLAEQSEALVDVAQAAIAQSQAALKAAQATLIEKTGASPGGWKSRPA